MRMNSSGSSLIEVLIAFAIMTLVLTVLLPAVSLRLVDQFSSSRGALAQDFAVSVAEELAVLSPEAVGQGTPGFDGWRWSVQSEEVTALNGRAILTRSKIIVLDSGGRELAGIEFVHDP